MDEILKKCLYMKLACKQEYLNIFTDLLFTNDFAILGKCEIGLPPLPLFSTSTLRTIIELT